MQVLHWFLNGAELQPGLVTAMEPVYPLEDKRGVARSLLKLPLTEETLPRYSSNNVFREIFMTPLSHSLCSGCRSR